jgi:hypothetical protein
MNWLLDQVRQPSTWRGFAALLASAGVGVVAQETVAQVGATVTAAIGLYDMVRRGRPFGTPGA